MEKTRSPLDELDHFLRTFEETVDSGDLRTEVKALVPVLHEILKIGRNCAPLELPAQARSRLLTYLRAHPRTVTSGRQLEAVAGTPKWARRVRELRVNFGWPILSGLTSREMETEGEFGPEEADMQRMKPRDCILVREEQDKRAPYRWYVAKDIRGKGGSARYRILEHFRRNTGARVTGEELRYVAGDTPSWARRVRELRAEEGWPIATKMTGRPDLEIGEYVFGVDR